MFYTNHIFFLADCYSSILTTSAVVCSESQGKMVAEWGIKSSRISFSFFKSSIHQGMQLPKSKWQHEFKGEATNWPVNPSTISTNDTTFYCQRCGPLFDLIFGRIAFLRERGFCVLEVELRRALLVTEYSSFSSPAGYCGSSTCRNSRGRTDKISICFTRSLHSVTTSVQTVRD